MAAASGRQAFLYFPAKAGSVAGGATEHPTNNNKIINDFEINEIKTICLCGEESRAKNGC